MKQVILTGDRPTGRLHVGHYVGSLKERVRLQKTLSIRKKYGRTSFRWHWTIWHADWIRQNLRFSSNPWYRN